MWHRRASTGYLRRGDGGAAVTAEARAPGDWQETRRLLFFADERWNPEKLPAWLHLWRLVDVVSRKEIDFMPDEWAELPPLE